MKLTWEHTGTHLFIASFAVLVLAYLNLNLTSYSEMEKSETPRQSSIEHPKMPVFNKTASGLYNNSPNRVQGPYPITPNEFHVILPPENQVPRVIPD